MKLIISLCVAALLAGCTTHAAKPQPSTVAFAVTDAPVGYRVDDPMFQFQGTWEGTLDGHSGPNLVAALGHQRPFRIVLDPPLVFVFQQIQGAWVEMKPSTFRISSWGPQAVVASSTSGTDEDGTWVEGSSFTLVRTSPSMVVAYWLRTVNNLNLQADDPDNHFAWEFSGDMRRVQE